MFDYTVRFYDFDKKLTAINMMSEESDLVMYKWIKQQLASNGTFQSAEILRDGVLLKTIIGE